MPSSHNTYNINDNGFDPNVHLKIAQESLRHLQDIMRRIPFTEKEYNEALRALKDAPAGTVKDRMAKLAEDMKALKKELEGAPAKITELKADIVLLKQYIAAGDGKSRGETSGIQRVKSHGGDGANGAQKVNMPMTEPPFKLEGLSKGVQGLDV